MLNLFQHYIFLKHFIHIIPIKSSFMWQKSKNPYISCDVEVSFQVKYIFCIKTKSSRPFRKRFQALCLSFSRPTLKTLSNFFLQRLFSLFLSLFISSLNECKCRACIVNDFADIIFLYTSNTIIIVGLRCQWHYAHNGGDRHPSGLIPRSSIDTRLRRAAIDSDVHRNSP